MPSGPTEPEHVYWKGRGVLVTDARLVAGRRAFPLATIEAIGTEVSAPRLLARVAVVALCAAVALPLLVLRSQAGDGWLHGPTSEALLVLTSLALFTCIAQLVMAGETYHLVVRTPSGERRAVRSGDGEFIQQLVAATRKAMGARAGER